MRSRLLARSLSCVALMSLVAPASRAATPIQITPPNLGRGFTVTSFATGFGAAPGAQPWLHAPGMAFLPSGEVWVSDPLGSGALYRFPSHADAQVVDSSNLLVDISEACPTQMVQVRRNGVWKVYAHSPNYGAPWEMQSLAELDQTTGRPLAFWRPPFPFYANSAMAAYPAGVNPAYEGHVFAILDEGPGLAIYDLDPELHSAALFARTYDILPTQLVVSADGSTLYTLRQRPFGPCVVALSIPGGFETWVSPSHGGGGEDNFIGMALGAGSLDGYLYVGTDRRIWEFGLPGGPHAGVDNLLAVADTSRGQYPMSTMFVDSDVTCPGGHPSLLVTHDDTIQRIDPPGGGWFGAPASTAEPIANSTTSVDEAAKNEVELRVTPNPVFAAARVEFALARAGRVSLDVLDVQGRVIAELSSGWKSAGIHHAAWDGTTGSGRARAGIYFLRLRGAGHGATQRLALVR